MRWTAASVGPVSLRGYPAVEAYVEADVLTLYNDCLLWYFEFLFMHAPEIGDNRNGTTADGLEVKVKLV